MTRKIQAGDFLVCSWGYDQTNIDFYKVVSLTASGKSARLQKWSSATVATDSRDYTHEAVVPGSRPAVTFDVGAIRCEENEKPAPIYARKISQYDDTQFVRLSSFENARLWSGNPAYETAAGYGH